MVLMRSHTTYGEVQPFRTCTGRSPETSLLFLAIPLGITEAVTTALGITKGLAARYRPQLQELADRLEQIGRGELTDGQSRTTAPINTAVAGHTIRQ